MNIEINTPPHVVKQWVTDYLKDKLLDLHHKYESISAVQVSFKERQGIEQMQKICEIELRASGDSLFIYKEADSYEQALRYAFDELSARINEWIRVKNDPPDESISTVNV